MQKTKTFQKLFTKIFQKIYSFFSNYSEYVNMRQNASKCMQNELCKSFVHEIIKELVLISFE